jgi:hypothetical protein
MTVPRLTWAALILALLAGCAGETRFPGEPMGDLTGARRELAAVAAGGAVPLEIRNRPAMLAEAEIARLAARGVTGLAPRFEAGVAGERRLVLWFAGPAVADAACRGAPGSGVDGEVTTLTAAWCAGDRAVAGVRGRAADGGSRALERLIWQSTGRLFPDDYAETYGFNLFGMRLTVGGSAGF